ncbi:MAG: divalent-cation tolerance protein CutA [Desulfurococcales archaeon]|nr:divalent-cation tolerance protein CutA [Desulfurococcales archaeon]
MSGDRVYVVLVTAPPSEAERLARALVERRLAACVNVVPGLRSVYWWEGRVEEAEESLLIIKTSGSALDSLLEAVKELHPYEVPEAIALPVEAGLGDYLEWVLSEVRGDGGSSGAKAG